MPQRHTQLADLLEAMADAVPQRLALITSDRQLTYAELDERATRLANHLAAQGIGAGDHVAIHALNGNEWVEAFYACFKLRGVPINVNYRYRQGELRYLYDNADAKAVIVGPQYVEALEQVSDALPGLRHRLVLGDDYEAALAAAPPERNFAERSGDDLYIVYTGGTTGMPKGVMWRNEDLMLGALNAYRQGAPIDSVDALAEQAKAMPMVFTSMAMGPMMHGGCQWAMGNLHVIGGTFVLYSEARFDAVKALRLAAATKTMSLTTMGDAMARPIAEALASARQELDLSGLKVLSNGAAPLSAAVREQLVAALPGVMISDGYGSSETGSTGMKVDQGETHAAPRFNIGPNTDVLDEDFEPCPVGQTGVLATTGHIPLGYYKDPEKTAATFPTINGRRWVISGDFARREEDGTVSVLGRGSVSINTGGEKVHPEEVEATLLKHPDIFDAVVVGTPNERWGQQVTALVQVRSGATMTAEDVRRFCQSEIADYKAPRAVLFVDTVPRTPVGKSDYKVAKELALQLLDLS